MRAKMKNGKVVVTAQGFKAELSASGPVSNGDTLGLPSRTYTFRHTPTKPGDVGIVSPRKSRRGLEKKAAAQATLKRLVDAINDHSQPIHDWFGLTYASYIVLPRVVLQSCSVKTQRKLIKALEAVAEEEKQGTGQNWPGGDDIAVTRRDAKTGQFKVDEYADYQRGRRKLWSRTDK